MHVLVTGATGKVGRRFVDRLLAADSGRAVVSVRALCHNRSLPLNDPRVSSVRGSIADRETVARALTGITHVVHLATCKETPDDAIDVAVKGLFWLLEEFRASGTARRFLVVGGDAAMGHIFQRHVAPITEATPHRAYPGCYALSKVLEEVMLAQYGIQYGNDWCCLRAPWIMEKDDFRCTLSFGADVFGGPVWRALVGDERADRYQRDAIVPVLCDRQGIPIKRNFVHVDDLVEALLIALDHPRAQRQLFNLCMDEPVDYQAVADHLARTRGLSSVRIEADVYSNWLDNSKAKLELGWRPRYDLERLIESAWSYRRPADDPRRVWYPG
jgi:nucleoside-diphosphate-sugar epimerase